MINKKNTPSDTNGESNQDKETLDSLAKASLLDLASSIYSEFRPYLLSEGEQLLGHEFSFDRAVLIGIQKHVKTRNETYEKALELIHALTKEIHSLREENKVLKGGYEDLCISYDGIKKFLHEISVRQKNHVERCDGNFSRIEKVLNNWGR